MRIPEDNYVCLRSTEAEAAREEKATSLICVCRRD